MTTNQNNEPKNVSENAAEITPEEKKSLYVKKFDISESAAQFVNLNPFFAVVSRHITKRRDDTCPTAAVRYNKVLDTFELIYNGPWMSEMSERERLGIQLHEMYHIVLMHVVQRRRSPHSRWNEATDLAINSLITDSSENSKNKLKNYEGERDLPLGGLIPGVPQPPLPADKKFTPEQIESYEKYSKILESLPKMQASEWYFSKMYELMPERPEDVLDGLRAMAGGMHDFWDEIPESERERIRGKINDILEKAVRHADSHQDGWGNIPVSLQQQIRASLENKISWRQKIRRFTGYLTPGGRSTSMRRMNRKYPLIYPGVKRGRVAKFLIAVDMSGSVSNEMLSEFSSEMNALAKLCSFDIVPFDCSVEEDKLFTWTRGKKIEIVRTRGGGTDFNAPTEYVNRPENRGRWDALLILTDGEAPKPIPCNIKRGWVIGPGAKMIFEPDGEEVIDMNQDERKEFLG